MAQRGEEVDCLASTMTPLWRGGEKGLSTMTPLLTEWERGSLQESGFRSRTLCLLGPPQQIVDEGGLMAMVERCVDSVPGGGVTESGDPVVLSNFWLGVSGV